MEEKLDKKWNNRKLIEETIKSSNLHFQPSPETRERLKALETTQTYMIEEITEVKQLVKGLDSKLDYALEKKADKKDVDKINEIITWGARIIVGGVLVALLALVIK